MKDLSISILMPVFNGEKTISRAIQSVLDQTYSQWELLIYNDGSTDNSFTIIESFTKIDARIKLFSNVKNFGRGFARQFLLEKVNSEFICFVDADDILLPTKLESQLKVLIENQGISLVACGVAIFDSQLNILGKRPNRRSNELIHYNEFDDVLFLHPTVMIRTNIAQQCKYNIKLNALEDEDFFRKYLLIGKQYYKCPEILYAYAENESWNRKKAWIYAVNALKYYFNVFNFQWIVFKKIIRTLFVMVLKQIVLLFVSMDYFLSRRNIPVSSSEKECLEKWITQFK